MWVTVGFSFYMVKFQLKYLPGNIYTNSVSSSGAEIGGIIGAGVLYQKFGIKISFSLLFFASVIGGFLILIFGEAHKDLMPAFIMLARIGTSGAFNVVYISNQDVFPTLFKGSAMGYCNFFTRIFCTLAPQIAEKPNPLPMVIFITINIIAGIVIQFIKTNRR